MSSPSGLAPREGIASLDRLWERLHQPVDTHGAIEALVGLPSRTGRQVIGAAVAASPEARALLDALPSLIRNLSISTEAVPERCVGAIRGPIMWGETLAAQASAAGDPGIFVCSMVTRAYDTPVNRQLVTALTAIVRGGRDAERFRGESGEEPAVIGAARHNADLAERFLDHRTLINVPPEPLRARATNRIRSDRRRQYGPVTAMLRRAAAPLEMEAIRAFCDDATAARHDLVAAALDHLDRRGVRVPPLFVADHEIVAGPLRFHHPAVTVRGADPGLWVGTTRLDIPDGIEGDDVTTIHDRDALVDAIDEAITRDRL